MRILINILLERGFVIRIFSDDDDEEDDSLSQQKKKYTKCYVYLWAIVIELSIACFLIKCSSMLFLVKN